MFAQVEKEVSETAKKRNCKKSETANKPPSALQQISKTANANPAFSKNTSKPQRKAYHEERVFFNLFRTRINLVLNIACVPTHMFGWTVNQWFRRAKMTNGITFKFFFLLQCRVLSYGPFDTLNTKVLEKIIIGVFLWHPPEIHYSALQCTAMYCSVNAWIIHSGWVKYDL